MVFKFPVDMEIIFGKIVYILFISVVIKIVEVDNFFSSDEIEILQVVNFCLELL